MSDGGGTPRRLRGRYRLDKRLGSGGMAEVWAAYDEVLDRRVAVKILRPALAADPRLVARFRKEAVAAARLSHPNIVGVFDTVSDDGTEAVVMELITGVTLRQVLDEQGRLAYGTVARIGAAVAQALDAAHRAGVVHRDVKPGNVLLAMDGRVLLADFGLAELLPGTAPRRSDGRARVMIGTAKYLSPEQVAGEQVDGRSDLYSLGVVMYECLTGSPPFEGDTDDAVARARLESEAPPVRARRPGTPRPLAEVITELLARDRDRRPATAAMVGDRLERMAGQLSDDVSALPADTSPAAIDPDATPVVAAPAPVHFHRRWTVAALSIVLVAGALAAVGLLASGGTDGPAAVGSVTTTTVLTNPTSPATTLATSPPTIEGLAEFDPPPAGDGRENPKRLGLLTDADPDTSWSTVCYETPGFAPKGGVGLVIELSRPPDGATLAVETPMVGWSVEVFESESPRDRLVDWGTSVGGGTAVQGDLRIQLTSRSDRYVLILLTRGTRAENCSNKNPYAAVVTGLRLDP
ncbi:MAG TPA: protein kinase [Acidimicrobiales bacterium]